jgi:iron complex outermembrane recepter protein
MSQKQSRTLMAASIALGTLCTAGTQVASAQVLEEVLVTAQKRAESIQDIPIAVSAFDQSFIQKSGIESAADLVAYTPGLSGQSYQATETVLTIRGIGTQAFGIGADSSVGMFIDDQPIGRTTLIGNSFFDVERIEVVKGPQGTLFGRNASAGAISVITNKANTDESSLDLLASAGDEGQQMYEGAGNWAINEDFALRLAARHSERDGTFENAINGDELNNTDNTNVRGALHYDFSDTLRLDLSAENIESNTRTQPTFFENAFDSKISVNKQPKQEIDAQRATMQLAWDLNDDMTLTSNTSYLDYDITAIPFDADATDIFFINLLEPQDGDQWVQEIRLNGSTDQIEWFAGASYIQENIKSKTTFEWDDFTLIPLLTGYPALCLDNPGFCQSFVKQVNFAETDNTSYALYGDVAWSFSDKWTLIVGARYTYDEKDFDLNQPIPDSIYGALTGDALIKSATDGKISDDDSWDHFDPRVILEYQFSDDLMLYGSVASGYKSGGFNSNPDITLAESTASGQPQKPASFDEETVVAYEIGVKSQFWDNRAQINGAIYFNDYDDFQIEDNANLIIIIQNAATVETYGLELDGQFLLTENLTLRSTYSYLNTEFTKGSFSGMDIGGNELPRAPENSGSVVLDWDGPLGGLGMFNFRGEYVYTGSTYFDAPNDFEQDSFGIYNARIGWETEDGRYGVAVIGENLDDEEYYLTKAVVLDPLGIPSTGRLYRVELTARF